MSEIETEPPATAGVDRRKALKRIAAGGAVAWTAPTLLSSKAHAVEFIPGGCTAKCTPIIAPPSASGVSASVCCGATIVNRFVRATYAIVPNCPCSPLVAARITNSVATYTGPITGTVTNMEIVTNANSGSSVDLCLRLPASIINPTGSVPPGTISIRHTYIAFCQDRAGRTIDRNCTAVDVAFSWNPGFAACGAAGGVSGVTSSVGGCTDTCIP